MNDIGFLDCYLGFEQIKKRLSLKKLGFPLPATTRFFSGKIKHIFWYWAVLFTKQKKTKKIFSLGTDKMLTAIRYLNWTHHIAVGIEKAASMSQRIEQVWKSYKILTKISHYKITWTITTTIITHITNFKFLSRSSIQL